MPFCPNCRIEYVADATRCAECGAALVPVLTDAPAAIGLDSTRPAELCQVEDLVQLDLIESQLHAAGIPLARRAPIIERYAELVRHMADADFEIELELPKGEE